MGDLVSICAYVRYATEDAGLASRYLLVSRALNRDGRLDLMRTCFYPILFYFSIYFLYGVTMACARSCLERYTNIGTEYTPLLLYVVRKRWALSRDLFISCVECDVLAKWLVDVCFRLSLGQQYRQYSSRYVSRHNSNIFPLTISGEGRTAVGSSSQRKVVGG